MREAQAARAQAGQREDPRLPSRSVPGDSPFFHPRLGRGLGSSGGSSNSGGPSSDQSAPPTESVRDTLRQLVDMGFPASLCQRAITSTRSTSGES